MTCSKRFGRLLQASCLGLIGTLTIVGCGGSDTKKNDASVDTKPSQGEVGPTLGVLKITPALLDFGRVDVGTTSTPQSVSVTVSVAPVAISPTVTGAGFVIAGTTCAASQPVGPCTISVAFAPTTIGGASGSLIIANGASVSLSGTGNQPGVFTAPDRIDLGTLKAGATAAVTVQIAPQGTLPGLTCTSSNPTELAPNAATTNCPATGAVSSPCVYGFTFTASTAGARTDTVTCTGGTKTTSTIVAATVVGPSSLAVSQNTAQFSAVVGKTDVVVITVSNNGQSPTAAAPVATITSGNPDFRISANDCVVALAPLSTCKVTVTYAPTAAGTKAGALSVADGATVLSVALTGVAITDRSVSITPSSPDFGSVTVGESKPTTFTMKNAGGTATGVITLSGSTDEFKIGSDQCSGAVLAQTTGTCTFVVTFAPAGLAGARSTIINASDAAGPLATAKLAGAALAQPKGALLSITPPTLDFGTTNVGLLVGPKVFTITNTGDTVSAALAVVKNDVSGAAQFTYTTTCVSALDPQTSCQVAVTFAPTIAGNASATIAVTDGAVTSKTSNVVGTALEKGSFLVKCGTAATPSSSYEFGDLVVNQTDTVTCAVTSPDAAKQATGALTIAATGDFAIPTAKNQCTASLIAGDTVGCKFDVTFTPTVAGARTGVLTVTGANGGVVTGNLSGTGLALVQLVALGATAATSGTSAVTGLDFGMTPNASIGKVFAYRLVVRGATAATATTTTPTLALAAGTPADYKFVSPSAGTSTPTWSATTTPCGSAVTLPPTASTSSTPGYPGVAANARIPASFTVTAPDTADAQSTASYYVCDFYVQFAPVSGKDLTTPKAATVTATATAGGTASLALTGIASGPLTIAPSAVVFAGTTLVGSSATAQTLTVTNNTTSAANQGVLSVAVGGTNAADFQLTSGTCLVGKTLAPGDTCTIVVTFAPSIAGAEGAIVTVTASTGGETATATLAGTGASTSALTVSPTAVSPASVSFGSVAQNDNGDWQTFTITNPATSTAPVGPITFTTTTTTSGANFQLYSLSVPGVTAYPNGSCGATGSTTSLIPGGSCTIQVRLIPGVNLGAINGTLTVNSSISIPLSGTGTPQLVLSGSAITLVSNVQTVDFGNVVKGTTGTKAFTVTNNGAASASLSTNLPAAAFDTVSTSGGCGSTLAAKQSCTLTVTFSPASSASIGAANQQLTVTGGTSVTVSANLTATVVAPAAIGLYAFPGYDTDGIIHLGAAPMDTSTGVLTLVFTNSGGSPTSNLQAALSGGADFTIPAENKGTCSNIGGVLNPGATCTVNVQATPTGAVGKRTAQLVVSATGVGGKTVQLDASGLTTSNSIWVTALSGSNSSLFTFSGSTLPAGVAQYFVLHNASVANVALGSSATTFAGAEVDVVTSAASTQFVLSKPAAANVPTGAPAACGTGNLTPGNNCTFAVTFTPATGTPTDLYRDAAVEITTAGGGAFPATGNQVALGLMGRAQLPATLALSAVTTGKVTVTGTAVDFGQILSGQTPSLTFTITNTGEVATAAAVGLLLQSASTSTANYATLGTSTCGSAALAANGGTCTVVVNSQLPGSTGAKAGLSVTATGAPVSTSPFTLAADVVAAASLSAPAPSTTSFGSIAVGSPATPITITVTNGNGGTYDHTQQDTGALSVTLSDATNFTVDSTSTCLNSTTGAYYSLPLSGGAEQCTIIVKFVPTSAGAKSTQVAITATPGGSPQAFTLTGTGLTTLSFQNAAQTGSASLAVATFKVDSTAATGLLKNSLSGSTAFTISRTTCFGATLTAGTDQCEVDVTFTGTPTATAQTATLTVTDGTANATATGTFTVKTP